MKHLELTDEEHQILRQIVERELERLERYSIKGITDTLDVADHYKLVQGLQ